MKKTATRRARPARAARRPRQAVREARNSLYRQHIMEAAEQEFAAHGFEAAKLQDISERVGLSMGTIYAIFPSKADLFAAIVDERGGEMLAVAREVAARDLEPLEALQALMDGYIGYFVAHPHFLRMHLRQGTSWVLSPSSANGSRAQHWQDIHTVQADIFRRGVEAGVFIDEDPAYLARMFSAMDQVLLADWVDGGMRAGAAALAARLAALVTRTFCVAPGG